MRIYVYSCSSQAETARGSSAAEWYERIYECICVCVYMDVSMYVYMCVCVCLRIYVYACTYIGLTARA